MCEAVEDFFSSGSLLREINCTIIALVPKIPNPSSMHDYRPISCCNTIYKCISKIIAARIKGCLPDIISPAQTAFVQGRSIADNILLTQELMKNYHLDSGLPRCALKIDLKKAYDSISWDCILGILSVMGTPATLLRCIKACITTPMFSVSVNGELTGFFASNRGVRQGDPLSSFLFLIAMEAFSRSFSRAVLHPNFDFHPRCKQINLSHLCFADDLFLFFWINKNLFPKGQNPTKNTHEVKKTQNKRKTDRTSPKTEEEGHQPDTKIHLITGIQSPTYRHKQHKQPIKTEKQTQHPHTGTTNQNNQAKNPQPGESKQNQNKKPTSRV